MERDLTPFSHCWNIANIDWICKNVEGYPKLETKIQYNLFSTTNEPEKFIKLELFPNGFDQNCFDFISLRIFAQEYIYFRLFVKTNDCENVLKIENSNQISKEIKIKNYIHKEQLIKNFKTLKYENFSICIEGVIVKTKNFNVFKFLNYTNNLIKKTTITYDYFDLIECLHTASIFKLTVENFQTCFKNNSKKICKNFQFKKNLNFNVVIKEKDSLTWKIYVKLESPISNNLFMWFKIKINDDNENESKFFNEKFNFY